MKINKKIIIPGLTVGAAILVVSMGLNYLFGIIFPSTKMELNNSMIFRAMDDPEMYLFFLYPFSLGLAFSWIWNKTKKSFKGTPLKRSINFGLFIWLITTVPGMIITYSSFEISCTLIFIWLFGGLVNGIISGLIFDKMNK